MPLTETRRSQVGWATLFGLIAVFVSLGLLKFLVFLLFMRLVTDLLVDAVGRRVRFASRTVVLNAVYLLVAALIVVIAAVVVPRFVAELPAYTQSLDRNLTDKLSELLASQHVSIDLESAKQRAMEWGREHAGESMSLARRAGTNLVLLVVAFIITFVAAHQRISSGSSGDPRDPATNLWDFLGDFIAAKMGAFYACFRLVMAGQMVIALINAGLTFGLLVVLGVPHKIALTVLVFVFGLLPIVGNLISNTIVCISALLWTGPLQVIAALVFLVLIHKLEYFLNGKIIGHIVKLPLYITLLSLIVGEALFHISGMILAIPVILLVREELSAIEAAGPPANTGG